MRLRRFRRRSQDQAPGEDSFLDIVANLVGVLIILVVVVGANAGSRIHKNAIGKVDQAELNKLQEAYHQARDHALNLENDNHQLEARIRKEQHLADIRTTERSHLLVQVQEAKTRINEQKANLSVSHQQVLEQSTLLANLKKEYIRLDSQYTSLQSTVAENETIEHFPTPIAQTVFSDEIHFRLRGGRLVHVPMNELVELMRDEWREKAKKLKTADETLETVGPVESFRLQYQLRADQRQVQTPYGTTTERYTEFTRFVLIPVSDGIGVPLQDALQQEDSDFRTWIGLSTPEKTTVSVWVYPDSFEEFNTLKKWLYHRGFKTACWPLSANSPISGGPSGYRSTAQ